MFDTVLDLQLSGRLKPYHELPVQERIYKNQVINRDLVKSMRFYTHSADIYPISKYIMGIEIFGIYVCNPLSGPLTYGIKTVIVGKFLKLFLLHPPINVK